MAEMCNYFTRPGDMNLLVGHTGLCIVFNVTI